MGDEEREQAEIDRERWSSAARSDAARRILVALQEHEDWRAISQQISDWSDQTDLRGICFEGADLHAVDLRNANLNFAVLRDACLDGADLSGAMLGEADFTGATLRNAVLEHAQAGLAEFSDCDLSHAKMNSSLLGRARLVRGNLTGASLRGGKSCSG